MTQAPKPLFTGHWDADLYPRNSRPIVEELVLHILLHGEVLVKDVDLLLNPTIRGSLWEKGVRTQFKSLLETGRVKVLLPPLENTKFDVDPMERPLTAVARERNNKRPHKYRMWRFTEPYQRYCAKLDPILRETKAIRFRTAYPQINDFAAALHQILKDESWRGHDEFKGIDKMAGRFAEYCRDPSLAVRDLGDEHIKPHATDFYRSIAYQCVRLRRFGSSYRRQRNMRNLLQSVYAYCEVMREQAVSAYCNDSLYEIPAPKKASNIDLSELWTHAPKAAVKIPVAANIGEILENVIGSCPQVRQLWEITERPLEGFDSSVKCEDVCGSMAQAFAEHSVKAEDVHWSPKANQLWHSSEIVHRIIFLIGAVGVLYGVSLSPNDISTVTLKASDFLKEHEVQLKTAEAVAIFTKPIMDAIRIGQSYAERDLKRDEVRQIIFNSLRSGLV